jgi:hypothetical protein
LAVIFLSLVPCVLFLPALLAGKMLYGIDTFGIALPFHAEVLQCLAAHQWPLWLNGVFGGMPGIASCNLQFAYPTDFIGSLCGLSVRVLDGSEAILHVALAGLGMFLFLRRLDRSLSGALLGAFFFALSGSEVSQVLGGFYNMMEGVAWVPWAFWAAHKAREEGSLFAWGLCGLAFALQILAGAGQLFAYTLPAVACFVLGPAASRRPDNAAPGSKDRPNPVHALGGLALALGLAFLLSAPQLWLTLQYLPLTARHGYTYDVFSAGSIHPMEALTWLVPGLYGWRQPTYHGTMSACLTSEYFGLLPWALAFGALSALWRRERVVRWMAALAVAAFFLAQIRGRFFYGVFQHLPLVSGFREWRRILFLVGFAVCSLAAHGWDALRTERTRSAALLGTALFGAAALLAALFAWGLAKDSAYAAAPAMPWLAGGPQHVAEALTAQARDSVRMAWALIAAGSALVWLCSKRLGTGTALVLALAFHGLDVSGMVAQSVVFVDPRSAAGEPDFTRPAPPGPGLEPWRVFDADDHMPNHSLLLGYENLSGAESMPMRTYLETQAAMQAVPGRWKDWADLMDVRYVFAHSKQAGYLSGDKVTIYANRGAFPRAWLVGKSVRVPSENAAYGLLADPRFHARDEVALGVDAGLDGKPPQGGVTWLARSPQAFSLSVATDRAAALVVADAWYPSWKASVDGKDTRVLKADGGLQAVLLAAGSHRVDFRFDPSLFYGALAAALAGLLVLLGLRRHEARPAPLRPAP